MTPNTPVIFLIGSLTVVQIVLAMGFFELEIAKYDELRTEFKKLEKEFNRT